jgi:hypothetical protein
VQVRDETAAHDPITVAKFARHIGRSVDAFIQVSLSIVLAHLEIVLNLIRLVTECGARSES